MTYDYDNLYRSTPQALGEPTRVFVNFFERSDSESLRVLDIGCGQGRDALFIARMGHSVVGVDLSPNGINGLNLSANKENLAIEGIVADISTFTPASAFDVILFDRTLHMLAQNERLEVLTRLIDFVLPRGWVLIADEVSNKQDFKGVFAASKNDWNTVLDKRGTLFLQCA